MTDDELTTRILAGMRTRIDELEVTMVSITSTFATKTELYQLRDEVHQRLDQTDRKLDQLHLRVVESEVRTTTVLNDLLETNREIKTMLRDRFELRGRLDKLETRVDDLERKP